MKKAIPIILVLSVIVCGIGSAMAEDFTLHAGVKFGDTMEQVKSKEQLELYYEGDYWLVYKGMFAGYNVLDITYYFGKDGGLNELSCYIANSLQIGLDEVNRVFDDLEKAITSKYGSPLSTDNPVYQFIEKGHTLELLLRLKRENQVSESNYIAWNVPCNDNENVKIQLIYFREKEEANRSYCELEYVLYTNDELKAIEDSYNELKQEQYNDL